MKDTRNSFKMDFILKAPIWFLSLFFIFIMSFAADAQPGQLSTKSKKAAKYYEEALKLYDVRQNKEAEAVLLKALDQDPEFVEAVTMLGYVYSDLMQPVKAIDMIRKAIAINPRFYHGNFFTLAQLELGMGRYQDAKEHYEQFLAVPFDNAEMTQMARRKLISCDFALAALKNPVPFDPKNAGSGLNSKYDEYFPSITADERLFLFTRQVPAENSTGWQEDFYVSEKVSGQWAPAHGIGNKINSASNEGAPSLSADGNILFFVACETEFGYGAGRKGFGSCDIFYSLKDGNDWTKPTNLGLPVCTKYWETQPSFSSDGRTLYFIRGVYNEKRQKETDIWTSTLQDNGKWSTPVKLPDVINSKGNEESVFIHPDNQTLYFSSDGHIGMGGLDIFMSRRQADGSWGEPVNLGYPINTYADENSILVSRDGRLAYFASDRPGGLGGLDIYSFELYEKARPGKTIYVKGKVIDAVTKKPLSASIEVIDLSTGSTSVRSMASGKDGEFLICLPLNRNYAFNASHPGYLFRSENYELTGNKDFTPIEVLIPLTPIAKDSSVVLRNVFFETAKYDLRPESKAELDKLVAFLNQNPAMKIELGGHTDNVGEKKMNQVLSENRAKSVMKYLIDAGIEASRLGAKGYGDTRPVVTNDSDEHRQQNRRTEFKVVSL